MFTAFAGVCTSKIGIINVLVYYYKWGKISKNFRFGAGPYFFKVDFWAGNDLNGDFYLSRSLSYELNETFKGFTTISPKKKYVPVGTHCAPSASVRNKLYIY